MHHRAACLVLLAGCGSDARALDAGGGDGGTGDGGGVVVSFQRDVVPLVNHCGTELCHGLISGGPTWPYSALVNVVASECTDQRLIVKPGDPAGSYLIQKLLGTPLCSGVRMPKLAVPFTEAAMQKLEDWIRQGAANN